jgi:hypothetical protein
LGGMTGCPHNPRNQISFLSVMVDCEIVCYPKQKEFLKKLEKLLKRSEVEKVLGTYQSGVVSRLGFADKVDHHIGVEDFF